MTGINNSGQVVGVGFSAGTSGRAAQWSEGSIIDLGGIIPLYSGGFRRNRKSVINLGALPGYTSREAEGINYYGQVWE